MRILFVTGFCKDTDSANINCANEVIEALRQKPGVEVRVSGEVLRKQRANVNWRKNPSFMVRKILQWPVIDPNASNECYEQIIKELEQTSYDAMIVSHMPYDAVLAAVKAKRRYPNLHLMLYELDPITYEIDKKRNSLGRYLYFMRIFAEKKTYSACDTILHMECNRPKFTSQKYKKFFEKSIYVDFPLVHDRGVEERSPEKYENQTVRFIYAGKLMKHFRSPEYLLKVLAQVEKKINLLVDFYSNGDCETLIEEYANKQGFIHQHGYVNLETLSMALDESDYLINIGNKYSDMLPSKLLSYIETGKPILHIQNQDNDACTAYLQNYEHAIVINENEPIEESAERIVKFVCDTYKARICSSKILCKFGKNTPEFTAEEIVKRII